MKSRQDSSIKLDLNLKQAMITFDKEINIINQKTTNYYRDNLPDIKTCIDSFKKLANKESLSNSELYEIIKQVIDSDPDSDVFVHEKNAYFRPDYLDYRDYYLKHPAFKAFIEELKNQIGKDSLDFFKILNWHNHLTKPVFKEVINNPAFNLVQEQVVKTYVKIALNKRSTFIKFILEMARHGIFSEANFDNKFVLSLVEEVFEKNEMWQLNTTYRSLKTVTCDTSTIAYISYKLIENYLNRIGNFEKPAFRDPASYSIEYTINYIKIIDLVRKIEGFPTQEVITALQPFSYYNNLESLYTILNYLNENKLLDSSNYNFFYSSTPQYREIIAKLIKSKCLEGENFSAFEMVEKMKGYQRFLEGTYPDIFTWFFEKNPNCLTQQNVAKILSHENKESLSRILNYLSRIDHFYEKNSSQQSHLIRIKKDKDGAEFFKNLKREFHGNPIYVLYGVEIYCLKDNFCTNLKLRYFAPRQINQIFSPIDCIAVPATTEKLKLLSFVCMDSFQINQEEFDEVVSCSHPYEAYEVILTLQSLNLLTPAIKNQVLTHPNQNELHQVITTLNPQNQAQLNLTLVHQAILLPHLELIRRIPDFLFVNNVRDHLLNLCGGANPNREIPAYINQVIVNLPNANRTDIGVLNTTQSTHTASVHKSVSESALRLKTSYQMKLREVGYEKTLNDIKSYINSLPGDESERLNKNSAAKRAMKKLHSSPSIWTFEDPTSKISSKEFIALAWVAIHDKDRCTVPLDQALECLINCLYEIQRGYNIDAEGKKDDGKEDRVICAGGTFNKIAQGLESIHPDIKILYITKAAANLKINESNLVLDLCLVYFKKKNLSRHQLNDLRKEANYSQVFKESWPDIRNDVAKEMIEFKDAYASNEEFDKFIDSAEWALNYDKLCEELEKFAPIEKEESKKEPAQAELPKTKLKRTPKKSLSEAQTDPLPEGIHKSNNLPTLFKAEPKVPSERKVIAQLPKKVVHIEEPNQPRQNEPLKTQENQPSFLLYLCCFLDEISLPVAFFIPIIGQIYLGARLANDLETLTNEKYSFFGCGANQAKNEPEPCQLNWNFAPV